MTETPIHRINRDMIREKVLDGIIKAQLCYMLKDPLISNFPSGGEIRIIIIDKDIDIIVDQIIPLWDPEIADGEP